MPLFALTFLTAGMVCAASDARAQQAQRAAEQTTQQAAKQSDPRNPENPSQNGPAKTAEKPAERPKINPSIPPPPPAEDAAPATPAAKTARGELPAKVTLSGGTRIDVVLETPLSTRIAKKGQEIVFRATQPIPLGEGMELSAQAGFIGIVVEAKRPGLFGRQGVLKVELQRIDLPSGTTTAIVGRLDSPDMKGQGRMTSDSRRSSDLVSLATWTLVGTAMGARAAGAKGAGYGAASGAAIALIMMMSHRGADVYLEPGMPFAVLLDQTVELPGTAASFSADNQTGQPSSAPSSYPGSDMPKLKHRPKP
jgi:hypothetical protein